MKTGGPAFPVQEWHTDGSPKMGNTKGMTLRDYFAAKALQAFITRETKFNPDLLMYAGAAYDVADAMLKVRKS